MAPPAKSEQSFGKLPTAAKAGLLVGIVALIGAVYYFALHMSLVDEIASARSRHGRLLRDIDQARERNAEYLRLSSELAARAGLDRANQHALPPTAEMPSFLQDLNRLGELSGLAIRLVEPRPEEPEEHYVKLPVNLELTGRYHQLARFFFNVSRLDRLISMENIHISDPQVAGEDIVVSVDVLATTYRAPDPPAEEQGQASAAAPQTGGGS
ncbi:MAG: type 4a pilus biogenesis protein PilO [Sandaracinaceae bacterium]|nr:type 4a pilus biogenesis protein PilO [Sandaracinaceae bacterium]